MTQATLDELALRYVGRFATSRSRLSAYLQRKLRERGWDGPADPDPRAVADRMASLGYIDDRAYASAKSRSLLGRGYGERRIGTALHAAGIDEADRDDARKEAADGAEEAALRFARRRRIGPFAASAPDAPAREKMIAAMLRAGHRLDLVRRLVDLPPGTEIAPEMLRDG